MSTPRVCEATSEKSTDKDLILAYYEYGDQRAFTKLVNRYYKVLCRYIQSQLRNDRTSVTDLTQGCFVRLFKRLGDNAFRESTLRDNVYGLLLHFAKQGVAGYWRIRKKPHDIANALSFDDPSVRSEQLLSDGNKGAGYPDADTMQILDSLLAAVIDELNPEQRDVIMAYYFPTQDVSSVEKNEETTYAAVAAKLGVPVGTAKGRCKAGMKRLRKALKRRGIAEPATILALLPRIAEHDPTGFCLYWRTLHAVRKVRRALMLRRLVTWTLCLSIPSVATGAAFLLFVLGTNVGPVPSITANASHTVEPVPLPSSMTTSPAKPQDAGTQADIVASPLPNHVRPNLVKPYCIDSAGMPVKDAHVLVARLSSALVASARRWHGNTSFSPTCSDEDLTLISLRSDAQGHVQLPRLVDSAPEGSFWQILAVVPGTTVGVWGEQEDTTPVGSAVVEMVPITSQSVAVQVPDTVAPADVTVGISCISRGGESFYIPRCLAVEVAEREDLAATFGFIQARTGTRVRFENMPREGNHPEIFAESAGFEVREGRTIGSVILLRLESPSISGDDESLRLFNLLCEKARKGFGDLDEL